MQTGNRTLLLLSKDASTADPATSVAMSEAEIRERIGKAETSACHEHLVLSLDLDREACSCCPPALSSEYKDNLSPAAT